MTTPEQIVVTQADADFVDEVTSAANLVTHDGYVEINTDAAILAAARFRIAATRAAEERIAGLVEALCAADSAIKALERKMGARCCCEITTLSANPACPIHGGYNEKV